MRKLIIATSAAFAAAALALPSQAPAQTPWTPCAPLVPCIIDMLQCTGSCVPEIKPEVCTLVTGRPCP